MINPRSIECITFPKEMFKLIFYQTLEEFNDFTRNRSTSPFQLKAEKKNHDPGITIWDLNNALSISYSCLKLCET